jgi:hypothetical protein
MAGKAANWLEYQRRHLSPEMFATWLAANPHLAALNARQLNLSPAMRALERFQSQILKEVIKPGLEKASKQLAAIEQSSVARDRTGLLRRSIGSTAVRLYPATFCGWVASGPRHGFGRVIQQTWTRKGRRKKKLKIGSRALTDLARLGQAAAGPKMLYADPVKYSHLVAGGRKAVFAGQKGDKATGKHSLRDSFTGKFFGRSVRAAAPKDFMAPAESQAQGAADAAIAEMAARVETLSTEN